MIGMIEDLDDITYFEKNKLESSSKSKNIYNYPAGYIPSFPDSVYCLLKDEDFENGNFDIGFLNRKNVMGD